MEGTAWFSGLDLSKLRSEDRRRILEFVISKVGKQEVQKVLGVSRYTIYRMLKGQVGIDDGKLVRLLNLITPHEFQEVLSSRKLLEGMGIVRSDGTVNYPIIMEILKLATNDEYLKQLIIRFVADNFREDVKKAIGLFPSNIEFKWDEGFEEFLKEHKKRRKVVREDTIKYYRNIFKKYLEGKVLSPELVDHIIQHKNKWLRNVFRHYIQYLYYRRKIPLETFGWLMEVVPSRHYKVGVKVFNIDLNLLKRTFEFLRGRHTLYYLYYLLMYYSGIRLEHVIKMVREFNPNEVVYIDMIDDYSPRLVCFEDVGFCRYYVGLKGGKPCEWVWFPGELLDLLSRFRGVKRDRRLPTRFAEKHGLLLPKYLRKLHWRIMLKVIKDRAIARFIQSRFGELRISEERYEDLLTEADTEYPMLMQVLKKGLEDVDYLRRLLTNKGPAH